MDTKNGLHIMRLVQLRVILTKHKLWCALTHADHGGGWQAQPQYDSSIP
jgi:hypothetical protein